MGTSFVSIDGKGFWMLDGMLELLLRLLALHLEDPTELVSENTHIRNQWLLASRGFFTGSVPTNLEKAVSTDSGRQSVVDAIQHLMQQLEQGPPMLDKDVLNLLGFENGKYTQNIETTQLLEIGQAFLDLIDGKIQSEASDRAFMPGCS